MLVSAVTPGDQNVRTPRDTLAIAGLYDMTEKEAAG
jgi:hypothetical protein